MIEAVLLLFIGIMLLMIGWHFETYILKIIKLLKDIKEQLENEGD